MSEIGTRYQSRAAGTFLMLFIDTVLKARVPRTEFWDTGLILDMSGSKDLIIELIDFVQKSRREIFQEIQTSQSPLGTVPTVTYRF